MGIIFGKITVECPDYQLVRSVDRDGYKYEIRRYPGAVAAEVKSDDLEEENRTASRFTSAAFRILANYIGVFTTPQNIKREGVAMTAPVVTTSTTGNQGEKVAMTAPVVTTSTTGSQGEKVAMTAPVVTTSTTGNQGEKVAMTAPVVTTSTTGSQGEKVAMTAPVVTTSTTSNQGEKVAMTAPVVTTSTTGSQGEKVAMTAPVVTTSTTGNQPTASSGPFSEIMAFLLPSKYTIETTPTPTDPRVTLREVPPREEAVYRYSGSSTMESCQPVVDRFYQQLRADGVKIKETETWSLYRYNPPYTIPWLRTNEIAVPIESTSQIE